MVRKREVTLRLSPNALWSDKLKVAEFVLNVIKMSALMNMDQISLGACRVSGFIKLI